MSEYHTIVADPPWPYRDANNDHGAISKGYKLDGELQRGVRELGYSTMSIDELRTLPLPQIAKDAHLYLWTTNAFMVDAHSIAEAWGFVPKTILTWVKVHQTDPCRVSMKTGHWFRGATEHIVFAVRGRLPLLVDEGLPTAYLWPRIGRHSVKPDAFFDLVEQASPGPRIELFSRTPRLGWDASGLGLSDPLAAGFADDAG